MWPTCGAQAAPILFDLESVPIGTFTPFSQTVGGVTAAFDSDSFFAYSIQTQATLQLTLSRFSGRLVSPTRPERMTLAILFSEPIDSISLTFATSDLHTPSTLRLTALLGAAVLGSATQKGDEIPGQYPQGTLSFASGGQLFDQVQLALPVQLGEPAVSFLVDNITVTPSNVLPPAIPEPGSLALLGIGLSLLVSRRRR
jgi:hypothetical protein